MRDNVALLNLREALRLEVGFRGYPTPRRKHMAEMALDQILKAIGGGIISLGQWELLCIHASFDALRQGQYDQARINAIETLRAVEERSTELDDLPLRSLQELVQEFQIVRGRPVMEP